MKKRTPLTVCAKRRVVLSLILLVVCQPHGPGMPRVTGEELAPTNSARAGQSLGIASVPNLRDLGGYLTADGNFDDKNIDRYLRPAVTALAAQHQKTDYRNQVQHAQFSPTALAVRRRLDYGTTAGQSIDAYT